MVVAMPEPDIEAFLVLESTSLQESSRSRDLGLTDRFAGVLVGDDVFDCWHGHKIPSLGSMVRTG